MNATVCTLFEGHYHFGLGALVNSLYAHGFRGTIWAGYRGPLPPWARPLEQCEGAAILKIAEEIQIRFVPVTTLLHLTNFKPQFMQQVLASDLRCRKLFYFDPDIVIKCPWSFFVEWAECGIAMVQEIISSNTPHDHPFRHQWAAYGHSHGFTTSRSLNQLFNGGFVGIKRQYASALDIWRILILGLFEKGISLDAFSTSDPTNAFNASDQTALNIMAMVTGHPLSTIGPEGMDFIPGGVVMSHATGGLKPWKVKSYTANALSGRGPGTADKHFFENLESPIRLYTKTAVRLKAADLKLASAIGRFIKRS